MGQPVNCNLLYLMSDKCIIHGKYHDTFVTLITALWHVRSIPFSHSLLSVLFLRRDYLKARRENLALSTFLQDFVKGEIMNHSFINMEMEMEKAPFFV